MVRFALGGLLLAAILLLSVSALDAADGRKIEKAEVVIDAPDTSVELVGYIYLPDPEKYRKPPLVVLLHQKGRSHVVWDDFARALAGRGLAALAIDLRGYGKSIYNLKRRKNRSPGVFYEGDFAAYPNDIKVLVGQAMNDWGYRLDTNSLAMIGSELGGNAGLLWAGQEPRVKYCALLSPGLDRKGLRIAPTIIEFGERPLYLVASEKDIYAAESCYLLSDVVDRVLEMDIFEGFMHGNSLLNANTDLQVKLINDLKRYLQP